MSNMQSNNLDWTPSSGTIVLSEFTSGIEENPSSRYFGCRLFPFTFNDVSFDFVEGGLKCGGTITVNFQFTVPEGEQVIDDNPSSRTFGLLIDVRKRLGNDYEGQIPN